MSELMSEPRLEEEVEVRRKAPSTILTTIMLHESACPSEALELLLVILIRCYHNLISIAFVHRSVNYFISFHQMLIVYYLSCVQ